MPCRWTTNLRLGTTYRLLHVSRQFTFGDLAKPDTFARATERCIGTGKCRSLGGDKMCPSYRASREEKYSTRGRARLLFELLKGEVIENGRQSAAVKDSLDHCLACKGCRSDCPTHVEVGNHKSHLLYEYHKYKRRHVMDAVVSRTGKWLPAATDASGVANALMRNPSFRKVSAKFFLARRREVSGHRRESFPQRREREAPARAV
ncbi:(Fe-S)-binding protein [Paraburkholderia tropica]|uniref:(Fe-S)-binding protein n=1 Tax=Paraburkholderia tropica TaxID=92647 RepID=UPI0032B505A0